MQRSQPSLYRFFLFALGSTIAAVGLAATVTTLADTRAPTLEVFLGLLLVGGVAGAILVPWAFGVSVLLWKGLGFVGLRRPSSRYGFHLFGASCGFLAAIGPAASVSKTGDVFTGLLAWVMTASASVVGAVCAPMILNGDAGHARNAAREPLEGK